MSIHPAPLHLALALSAALLTLLAAPSPAQAGCTDLSGLCLEPIKGGKWEPDASLSAASRSSSNSRWLTVRVRACPSSATSSSSSSSALEPLGTSFSSSSSSCRVRCSGRRGRSTCRGTGQRC